MKQIKDKETKLIILNETHLNALYSFKLKKGKITIHDIELRNINKMGMSGYNRALKAGYSIIIEIGGKRHILQYNCN